MINNKNKIHYTEIQESMISHGSGKKRVFISNEDTDTALTQFAWARFESGESCQKHSHPTMDEYFFVYKGSGIYEIGDDVLSIEEGDFIKIPSKTYHKLYADKNNTVLELIYFGIATN